jgi:copper chaperone CopZ
MKCEEIRDLLALYVDGFLSPEEKLIVERHLQECPDCIEEFEQLQNVVQQLHELDPIEIPAGLKERIQQSLQEELGGTKKGFLPLYKSIPFKTWSKVVVAAAVVLLALSLNNIYGSFMPKMGSQSQDDSAYEQERAGGPSGMERDNGMLEYSANQSEEQMRSLSAPQNPAADDQYAAKSKAMEDSAAEPKREQDLMKASVDRKIIKNVYLRMRVSDFEKSYGGIINQTEREGGFVENSQMGYADNGRWANLTLRVPAPRLQAVLEEVKGYAAQIFEERQSGDDVTRQYIDIAARLKSLRSHEESLLGLYGKAKNVEEMIQIESELNRVRTEIESLDAQIRFYEEQVSFATININMKEEKPLLPNQRGEGVLQKAVKAFFETLRSMVYGLGQFVIAFARYLPFLLIAGVIIGLMRMGRKKNKKED